ncbi:MAG: DUF4492 domain-containing protein [Tannerellaceae bacterium]|jgi:hypothetical protein|nr:DUF4492 domain-containing protein [Tannerellaceae bacterium]
MKREFVLVRVYRFYRDGFREMKLGKTLWAIILIKLFIMFFILKLFFFPSFLGKFKSAPEKQEYVSGELIDRAIIP